MSRNKLILILLIIIYNLQLSLNDELKESNRLELLKSPLNDTINDFGLKILQQLIKNDENQCNVFISPFSIMLMFTMLLHAGPGN